MAGLCCRQVVPSGPAQVQTCHVGSRPVPGGGAVGYCVPFGWSGLFRCLGAQRPGGPAYPAGVPISPEKWGERGPGASPLDPRFYGPLVGTRSFWGWVTHCSGRGAVSVPICVPGFGFAFCGSRGWARKLFVAETHHLRRLPLGGKLSPKVTDEGAILYPTFPCRRRDLSPQRLPSPAPLGQSVAPSSDPASPAHLPPEGKALGVGEPLPV